MLIDFKKATFDKNRLILQDNITIDEWKQLGQSLKQVEGSVQFWIGDWARYGDKRGFTGNYTDPKVYDRLEKITGLDRKTIQEYKSVSERTSTARAVDLSYTHHREVASLPENKQVELLEKARTENLSSRELKKEVAKLSNNTEFLEEAEVIPPTKEEKQSADMKWAEGIIKEINSKPVLVRLKIRQSIKQ